MTARLPRKTSWPNNIWWWTLRRLDPAFVGCVLNSVEPDVGHLLVATVIGVQSVSVIGRLEPVAEINDSDMMIGTLGHNTRDGVVVFLYQRLGLSIGCIDDLGYQDHTVLVAERDDVVNQLSQSIGSMVRINRWVGIHIIRSRMQDDNIWTEIGHGENSFVEDLINL